jgi:hypothetical protein
MMEAHVILKFAPRTAVSGGQPDMVSNPPRLTEPVPIKLDFVTGCGVIEAMGDSVTCSVLYTVETVFESGANREKAPVIKRKILMSRQALADYARMIQEFLTNNP